MESLKELSITKSEIALAAYSAASAPQSCVQYEEPDERVSLPAPPQTQEPSHKQLNARAATFTPSFTPTFQDRNTSRSNTLSSIATTTSSCHCHSSQVSCQQVCALYTSIPLPTPTKISPLLTIRLLCLKAGPANSLLDCVLFTSSPTSSTRFTALSYVWGDQITRFPLLVNNRLTSIGSNLYSALTRLRRPNAHVTLWVDAICIDQNNVDERGSQVQHMPEVYRAADEVVAWLGDSENGSELAMEYISTHGSRKKSQNPNFSSLTPDIQIALNDLWTRQYWTRVWVVQELASARRVKNRCLFRCGHQEVSFEVFRRFLANFLRAVPFTSISSIAEPRRMLTLSSHAPSMPFLEILWESARLQTSDERDRIFGIRGISPGFYRDTIKVDYNVNFRKLCRRFMVQYLKKEKSLNTLSCFHPFPSGDRNPSWLCDLSNRNSGLSPFAYWTSGKRSAEAKIVGDVLHAKGVSIGTVVEQQGPYQRVTSSNYEVSSTELENLRSMAIAALRERYPEDDEGARDHRLWNMVARDQHLSRPDLTISSSLLSLSQAPCQQLWLQHCSTKLNNPHPDKSVSLDHSNLNFIFKRAIDRCFFKTNGGHIGLGPPNLSNEDLVCVLYGCNVCIILRPTKGYKGFRFMGPAYVEGGMSGEFISTSQPVENMKGEVFLIH